MANRQSKLVEVAPGSVANPGTAVALQEISQQMIARRAYEKWQLRGCPAGQDQEDWFTACAELEQEVKPSSQAGVNQQSFSSH